MVGYAWIVSVIGNVITLGGAFWTAWAVILTDEQAGEIAASGYGGNPNLKKALLVQSTAAKRGLWAVGFGTLLQIIRECVEHL